VQTSSSWYFNDWLILVRFMLDSMEIARLVFRDLENYGLVGAQNVPGCWQSL
jgi:hypothetical protein